MGRSTQLFLLLLLFIQFLVIALTANGATNEDFQLLLSLKEELKNTPDWKGADPCDNWVGIECTNSRVTSIILTSMNLTGKLSSEIGQFSELQTLDLSYNEGISGRLPSSIGNLTNLKILNLIGCSFYGSIPDTIGNLQKLTILSLTNNSFGGPIPASIGHLSKLYWLDLAENQLDGPIPVSNGNTPGLDMLLLAKHFHLDHNKLSGEIPPQLFSSKMVLIHVLLNSNNLIGNIPDTLGLVQTLEVIRFDRNSLSGSIPSNLNNLVHVSQLFLSNNNLTGPIPKLTGMNFLYYVDMSNNSFDMSEIPQWFSPTLESLTTLMMENTRLRGQVPVSLFNLANLQTVILRNNQLNGTVDVGTTYSNQLQLIDLQNNSIISFVETARGYNKTLILMDNPFCQNNYKIYCIVPQSKGNSTYSTLPNNCVPKNCNLGQVSSPNCKCAYPYTGTLVFRAPSLGNSSYYIHLQESLMNYFQSQKLPVDSVSLSNPIKDSSENLEISLQVFPSGQDRFNQIGISSIGFVLSNQTDKSPQEFGPFFFMAMPYGYFADTSSRSGTSPAVMSVEAKRLIAILAISLPLAMLTLGLFVYCLRRKLRKKGEDLAQLDLDMTIMTENSELSDVNKRGDSRKEEVKMPLFSFKSVSAATDNFSDANKLGEGGFGPVYKGVLLKGNLVAVKRLSRRSGQGWKELKNEAMLIAKLQHKNLVRVLGCCIERDEKILVYEYMPNKSLDFFLFDPEKRRLLDWHTRIRVIEGIAQGLLYLHQYSRLKIIHRDLKPSNILLDCEMNPKILDFGMARIFGGNDSQANTNGIVGTYGYMSPEYALEGLFSIKSDVFSFGVLLLEIVSGRKNTGFYQTDSFHLLGYAWDSWTSDRGSDLVDPLLDDVSSMHVALRYVNIALLCVQEGAADRPTMSDVVAMLSNESAALPYPKQPAFLNVRGVGNANPISSGPEIFSVNNATVSIMEGR